MPQTDQVWYLYWLYTIYLPILQSFVVYSIENTCMHLYIKYMHTYEHTRHIGSIYVGIECFNINDNCLVQEKLHKHLRLFAQQVKVDEVDDTSTPVSVHAQVHVYSTRMHTYAKLLYIMYACKMACGTVCLGFFMSMYDRLKRKGNRKLKRS